MAEFERRVFALGNLLVRDQYEADDLRRAFGDPMSCHAVLGLQDQFVSAWWWLLGSAVLKKDDELIEKIGGDTLDAIYERHWVRSRCTMTSVELMALLLIDTTLARRSGQLRYKMCPRDDTVLRNMIVEGVCQCPRESLELVIDDPLPTGPFRHISVNGDPSNVDARMTYTALLCLAITVHRSSVELSDAPLPDVLEMRAAIKSNLSLEFRESLRRLLLLCYCPRQKCFAGTPGGEPHAGYVFCTAAALSVLDSPDIVEQQVEYRRKVAESISWLTCRLPGATTPIDADCIGSRADSSRFSGSMNLCNGRPGKDGDVCYCFWVLAALRVLRAGPIPPQAQARILAGLQTASTPDSVFAKGPLDQDGMTPDIFHTYFGQLAQRILENREVNVYFGAPAGLDRISPGD